MNDIQQIFDDYAVKVRKSNRLFAWTMLMVGFTIGYMIGLIVGVLIGGLQ